MKTPKVAADADRLKETIPLIAVSGLLLLWSKKQRNVVKGTKKTIMFSVYIYIYRWMLACLLLYLIPMQALNATFARSEKGDPKFKVNNNDTYLCLVTSPD